MNKEFTRKNVELVDGTVNVGDNVWIINNKKLPYMHATVVKEDWLHNCSASGAFKYEQNAKKQLEILLSQWTAEEIAAAEYERDNIVTEISISEAFLAGVEWYKSKKQ